VNVLFLSPYPPTFGGTVRIHQLMRQEAQQHSVFSLSYSASVEGLGGREDFMEFVDKAVEVPRPNENKRLAQGLSLVSPSSSQRLHHRTTAMQVALERMIEREAIDVVVVEFSQMACFDIPPGPAVIVDEHNVEWDLLQRAPWLVLVACLFPLSTLSVARSKWGTWRSTAGCICTRSPARESLLAMAPT
jgi:hypothetical protein